MPSTQQISKGVLAAVLYVLLSTIAIFSIYAAESRAPKIDRGPKIVLPSERVVLPGEISFRTEQGPMGHLFTEFELWRVSKDQLTEKVWTALIESGDLTTASIDDGKFTTDSEGLLPWKRYAIRARHGSNAGTTDWGLKRTFRTDDGSEKVFNQGTVGDVEISIPLTSWQPIDDEALSACEFHPRSYYPGAIRVDGVYYPGSGLRVKGGCGSSRNLNGKAAFKANMSWDNPSVEGCPETRRYQGLKKLTFNNQVQDASFTHERIGYDFLNKLGVPVPRVAPVRLHVNDELWGLYLHVETIDRRFLSRRFESNDGMLYEAGYGCDLGDESCFEEKFDTDACDDPRAGDITTIDPLRSLHGRLSQLPVDNIYPKIRQIIDFDAYLTTWAAATVMGFFDGYPYNPNNYRVYHDPSNDRWTLIPTGIDQLFERDVNPFNPVGLLSVRCLAEKDCRIAFRKRLAEVIDVFEAGDYPAMARAIERQVEADVAMDPRREVSVAEWHEAVDKTISYMKRRPLELRELLARTEIEEQFDSEQHFSFHALTDPRGRRFVSIRWFFPVNEVSAEQQWVVAQGYFDALEARMDAFSLQGGSGTGVQSGSITVGFEDCQTAMFIYEPADMGFKKQIRTAPIDPKIWKYCS